jgi:hypothetical protein
MADRFEKGEWVKVDDQEAQVTTGGEFIVHVQREGDKNPTPVLADEVEKWSHK